MLANRYEPSAEILDWTTYKRTKIAKGRLVSRKGLVAEIGEVGAALISLRLPDAEEAGQARADVHSQRRRQSAPFWRQVVTLPLLEPQGR